MRLFMIFLCSAVLIFAFLKWNGRAKYEGPTSDHFDGTRFHNQHITPSHSLFSVLRWLITRDRAPWPTTMIATPSTTLPSPNQHEIIVTFVNHASSLIQTGKINILTDPQYSYRASPVTWAGPFRVHEPGIPYEKLPKIDVVIISHDHYDHMDKRTLQMLQKDHKPIFLVGLGNDVHLKSFGISEQVQTLDYWKTLQIADLKITLVPAQHFSGRGLFDRNTTLWGGYVIQMGKTNLFFAGDTGYGPHFKEIRQRFGAMDLSMIPIGAYCPRWFMQSVHVNPEDAVLAHLDLGSKKSFGIHFKTFQMADEGYEQPVIDLEAAKKQHNIAADAFVAPEFGESFVVNIHS